MKLQPIFKNFEAEHIVVDNEKLENVIAAIIKHAKTGEDGSIGDGKIFIYNIENAIRIRTGEEGAIVL